MSEKEVPEGWESKKLENICSKITDGVHAKPEYTKSGIPFISVRELQNNTINFENCKYISKQDHLDLIKRCNPELGDILVSKTGSIGRIAIIETPQEFSLFVNTALIKPLKDEINRVDA